MAADRGEDNRGEMKLSDLPYPLRLCTELMHFAGLGANGMTDNMRASEIKEAVGVFFPPEMVNLAQRILCGEPVDKAIEKDLKPK